jgi:uncharacterized membrane protein YsdA (DUF1294 family)
MHSTTHNPKTKRLLAAAHYLAVLVLLLKAISYLDREPLAWFFIGLCVGSATIILTITIFHHRIQAKYPRIQCIVFLVEATVCAVIAYNTFTGGKTGLPFAWGLAAIILLGRGLYELKAEPSTAKSDA